MKILCIWQKILYLPASKNEDESNKYITSASADFHIPKEPSLYELFSFLEFKQSH